MRKTIQRSGILFASVIFALTVSIASAHVSDKGGKGKHKCYLAGDLVCYFDNGINMEICVDKKYADMICESITT